MAASLRPLSPIDLFAFLFRSDELFPVKIVGRMS